MNDPKFGLWMYPGHLQSWLDFDYGLLVFVIWVQFWLSEMAKFGVAMHFLEEELKKWSELAGWCILTILKTD